MTKRICLALAAGALLTATPAAAQQPATTYPATSGTIITTPTYGGTVYATPTVLTADESTTVRRGLFARIRARREARSGAATTSYGPVISSPVYAPAVTTTPGTIVTPTPAPATTAPTVPMQMPGKMSMTMPGGMQTVVVNGMAYTVPMNLPPEGVVVSERIVTPTGGMVVPASGTMTPGMVVPATYSIPLRAMPMPR